MSKESKPRDLWRQLYASAHDRPDTWCKSCGYYHVVHGVHRADCAVNNSQPPHCLDCDEPLIQPASITARRCEECRRFL